MADYGREAEAAEEVRAVQRMESRDQVAVADVMKRRSNHEVGTQMRRDQVNVAARLQAHFDRMGTPIQEVVPGLVEPEWRSPA